MFDIGFTELLLIGIVALVVIGPERLPKVARTAGHLFGRMQRYVSDVKADINREIQLDELKKLQEEMHASVNSIENAVKRDMQAGGEALQTAAQQIHEIVELPVVEATAPEPALPETPPPTEESLPQLELDLGSPDQPGASHEPADVKENKHV